jgi:hypothetical protein
MLTALFLLMAGDWRRAIACMMGFMLMRAVLLTGFGSREALPLAAAGGGLRDE